MEEATRPLARACRSRRSSMSDSRPTLSSIALSHVTTTFLLSRHARPRAERCVKPALVSDRPPISRQVCELLSLRPERVLVHWACAKLRSPTVDALSDEVRARTRG